MVSTSTSRSGNAASSGGTADPGGGLWTKDSISLRVTCKEKRALSLLP